MSKDREYAGGLDRRAVIKLLGMGGLATFTPSSALFGEPQNLLLTSDIGLSAAESSEGLRADDTQISVNGHQIRYVSGQEVYVEELLEGQWISRYWGTDGRTDVVNESWKNGAFEIRIKDAPSAPNSMGSWEPFVPSGTLLSKGWQWVSASELPRTDRGARHFVVELSSSIFPVTVRVHTLLDGTPVLTRYLEISNTSSKPFALTSLSPWAGRIWAGEDLVTVGHSIEWQPSWEGWFGWTQQGMWGDQIEESRGLQWDDPYFILHNDSKNEYFFGELAWPANYLLYFLKNPVTMLEKDIPLTFKIGPTAADALRVIRPGELIKTPAVHLGLIKGDFDEAVQAMHRHIRLSVIPSRKPERSYLIQYLIPEDWPMTVYRGEEFNEVNLKKCMDVVAAVGMEVFILDGPMWGSAYGNWLVPNEKRFPNGLLPLVEYAHQKGLLFGLYFETEGGRNGSGTGAYEIHPWSESKVFREHPDWFVQPGTVLNLSIPEAAAYLESELSQIIDHYKLDLYRHDFNGPPAGQGSKTLRDGFVENDYWRHYDALYGIFERVHEKYPDLILQQASGGGRRSDLDTAGVFHEQNTSDRATMPFVYRMLSGYSVFLPPEILVNPTGLAHPKDLPDLDTMLRGAYALGNTPMIFNSILPKSVDELRPEMREKFLHYSDIYKKFIRPMLPTCKVYHHAPVNATGGVESGDWLAMEFTSPDRRKGWATIIHLSKSESRTYLFKPKGLDERKKYRVTFDNTGRTQVLEGSDLMREGITVQVEEHRASDLLLIE